MIGNKKEVLPFNPKNRMLFGFSYNSKNEKFQFDINAHWVGKQRLPDTKSNPIEYQRPDYSETYSVINSQITFLDLKI